LLKAGETTSNNDTIAKAESFLFENLPKLRRPDQGNLPNIWDYIYGIQALSELAHREPVDSPRRKQLEELIRAQIKQLEHFETVHGGWFYYASDLQLRWHHRRALSTLLGWWRSTERAHSG
jgi:hypothetical protein